MNIINLVSAHTGNDAVNHGFELGDGIIGIVGILIAVILIFIIKYLIKKHKRK